MPFSTFYSRIIILYMKSTLCKEVILKEPVHHKATKLDLQKNGNEKEEKHLLNPFYGPLKCNPPQHPILMQISV